MIKKTLTAMAVCISTALPGLSQTGIGTPVTAEIMPGWVKADGTRIAALKFTLASGWKTYWRAPGDAGVPPQFDWSQSENLNGVGITWPAPTVFREGGVRTIGYKDELILPITLAPHRAGKPMHLNATLDFGVCSDICVPQQLKVGATLDTAGTTPVPAIVAALAARPYSGSEAGVTAVTCALRPSAAGLEIEASLTMPPTGGREVVVIEPGQPGLWMSETDVKRKGKTLTATGDLSAISGGVMAIDRSAITITVLGAKQAVEIKGCSPG